MQLGNFNCNKREIVKTFGKYIICGDITNAAKSQGRNGWHWTCIKDLCMNFLKLILVCYVVSF
jgi:hypothetical protein